MSDIANTEQTEAAALPSLFEITDEIEHIDIKTQGLLCILPISADHISSADAESGDALMALFCARRGHVDELRSIADNIRAHHDRERDREKQGRQKANPGSVVPIKPRARASKGGVA